MSHVRAWLAAMALLLLVAAPVQAARPEIEVVDVASAENEAETEAFLLVVCGFAIDFEGEGHVITQTFDRAHGQRVVTSMSHYRLSETFSANGTTIVVRVDAGPDIFFSDSGVDYLAITGRSITGSGVIGRTVYDLETGEVVSQAGNEVGDFLALLCTELAP